MRSAKLKQTSHFNALPVVTDNRLPHTFKNLENPLFYIVFHRKPTSM